MKFNSLKEFWEWLTISTGCYKTDYEALNAFMFSVDYKLLTKIQTDSVVSFRLVLRRLSLEQQELELK